MFIQVLTIAFVALSALPRASPVPVESSAVQARAVLSPYVPIPASCPSSPLVRPATSINSNEASYVSSRQSKANVGLSTWLAKQGSFSTSSLPVVGFTSSGGGYRALLTTAGVVQGFDSRDSNVGTSGIYQGLTYQAGLSGGAWFLSSLSGNNWPTVTSLKKGLWEQAFMNSALVPANLLSTSSATEYAAVTVDITEKQAAGYHTTIVDVYGRLLSYQFLESADGGVSVRLSGLTTLSNFTSYNVPYPIITTTEDFVDRGQCYPALNSPIWEWHPYEYGSWDKGISAFAQTMYMGSNLTNGQPTKAGVCTVHYDNIGYIFGTSSDVFNGIVCEAPTASNSSANLADALEAYLDHSPAIEDFFGIYPNPFYKYSPASDVSNDTVIYFADGGETDQNNPIWPFIQPERKVTVLIVNDNSADTTGNFPNGSEIYQTYTQAQANGLSKMPTIPPVSTFVAEGLNERATFFGCNQTGTVFIVYLPNVPYTYPSGQSTAKIEYTIPETDGMIANGVAIATQNGTAGWPFCLACALKNADGTNLPAGCNACFSKYCYHS